MAQGEIHKLIERYFDANLSIQEEAQLRLLLSHTNEDTMDIREAKATMGIFATNRKLTGKKLPSLKPQTVWSKFKYAAVFAIGILFDALIDFDDPMDNNFKEQ